MKAVFIGEGAGASRDAIMAVYPRHKVVVDAFKARGEIIGIGPFMDGGNMGIFRTRAAAANGTTPCWSRRRSPEELESLGHRPDSLWDLSLFGGNRGATDPHRDSGMLKSKL